MTTTTEYKATKTRFRKDSWGLARATWDYRDVNLNYAQRTTRGAAWHVVVYGQRDWWRMLGRTKAEMMAKVDAMVDEEGYKVEAGKLIHPDR